LPASKAVIKFVLRKKITGIYNLEFISMNNIKNSAMSGCSLDELVYMPVLSGAQYVWLP
jgi:hypothetical protein